MLFGTKGKFSICTWNSRALFGSIDGNHARLYSKLAVVQSLASQHEIVVLQETHGTDADLRVLQRKCPTHKWYGTFSDYRNVGGSITGVDLSLLADHGLSDWHSHTILAGRSLVVSRDTLHGTFAFVNVHIDSTVSSAAQNIIIKDLKAFIYGMGYSAVFLCGNFNFVHSDEGRLWLATGSVERSNDGEAAEYERSFSSYVEIHQGDYNRRSFINGCLGTLSRLDRCYTSINSAVLSDYSFAGRVSWSPTRLGALSGHPPVCFTISKRILIQGQR